MPLPDAGPPATGAAQTAARDAVDEVLIPLDVVQQTVLSQSQPLGIERFPIDEALGLVLAEDVTSAEDVPPFANSAMDGYAVRTADAQVAPVELRVIGMIAAGKALAGTVVGPGQAAQIMTGASIPEGADGIAIVERTERHGDTVKILDPVAAGSHLRTPGSDIRAGSVVMRAGTKLGPAHIGVLASVGAGRVAAWRRPRVGVLSTGDELVELAPDGSAPPLEPGQIRESNRHALLALLRRDGLEAVDLGIVADTREAVTAVLQTAVSQCDAVLTSGGVSMGELDFVKAVLSEMAAASPGGAVEILKLAIRPAKPLVLAWLPRPSPDADGGSPLVPVFGLPGNPVSSMVSYQVVALPALRVMAGHPSGRPRTVRGRAGEDIARRPDGKLHLMRVRAEWAPDGRLEARLAGGQQSHQLSAMTTANALAMVPDGAGVPAGGDVELILFNPVE